MLQLFDERVTGVDHFRAELFHILKQRVRAVQRVHDVALFFVRVANKADLEFFETKRERILCIAQS